MDAVRDRVRENARSRRRKLLMGSVALIILVTIAILLENNINDRPTEVTIMKNEISDEKAVFIPLKKLDTNIIAVKASDGSYRLAFDDCIGCYHQFGKHAQFKNNPAETGLICENCKSEVSYDEMGYLTEESMPYPIAEIEITSLDDRFVISADYLAGKKQVLQDMRKGKITNGYSENPNN